MKHHAPTTVQLMGDDRTDRVEYRRKFAALTGSVTAAILLNRIIEWAKLKGYEPFYKFREPCKHDRYKSGDSWVEDLEFTPAEFDNAIKVIGTKLKSGMKRADVEAVDYPIRAEGEGDADYLKRFQFALQHLVIYWTDNNRVTWYELNSDLLDKFTNSIYLDSCSSVKYLRASVYGVILKARKLKVPENLQEVEIHSSSLTPKEQTPKEEKIDHARDSLSSSTDIQAEPEPPTEPTPQSEAPISPPVADEEDDPEYPAEERHATFEAVKQRLLAEGYAPDAPVDPLPNVETTPIPFHIANGLGMSGYEEPYWKAYQRGGDGFLIEQRKPHDAELIAAEFKRLDVIPEDVEAVIRNYLPTRKAGSRFTFEFALREVRKWKVSQSAPIERDSVLVAVVQTGWGYAPDTDASNRIVDFLSGAISEQDAWQDWGKHQLKDAPMTPSELQRFIGWYRSQSKDRSSPPRTAKSLRENIDAFRATQRPAVSPSPSTTFTPLPRSVPISAEERKRIREEVQARQQTEGALP